MVIELTIFKNEQLHLADISRKLNQPHPTVRLHLNKLEKQGLLSKSKKGNLTLYKLNLNNPILLHHLTIAEKLFLLEKAKNLKFKEILEQIANEDVIIFGSAVNNFEKANDIDILTTSSLKLNSNKKLHVIKVKSLSEVKPALKEEIMKNHIIINNTERAVRWLYWHQ